MRIKKELNPECGKRLRECIIDAGITQKELARRANYTPQYITGIVQGKKRMSLEAATEFSKILEVDVEYILCDTVFKTKSEEYKSRGSYIGEVNDLIIEYLNYLNITTDILFFSPKLNDKYGIIPSKDLYSCIRSLDNPFVWEIEVNEYDFDNNAVIYKILIDDVQIGFGDFSCLVDCINKHTALCVHDYVKRVKDFEGINELNERFKLKTCNET